MKKLRILVFGVALLTAACGGAATSSSSKTSPATIAGAAQINGGANAGSDLDVNHTNPTIHNPAAIQPRPSATSRPVAPAAPQPAFGTAFDRCGGGIGTGVGGNRTGSVGEGRRHPLPMCAVQ